MPVILGGDNPCYTYTYMVMWCQVRIRYGRPGRAMKLHPDPTPGVQRSTFTTAYRGAMRGLHNPCSQRGFTQTTLTP